MRIDLQPGYILHSRPYRDSSALLEVLTAEYGRLALIARGARRQGRKRVSGNILRPFLPLLLSYSGRGELRTLVGSELAGTAVELPGERLFSGLYLNELIMRLVHRHDPHPRLFALYSSTLASLGAESTLDAPLRRFELGLLEELGYSLDFTRDGDSAPVEVDGWYSYQPEQGMVRRLAVKDSSPALYAGRDLLQLAAGNYDDDLRQVSKRLFREILASHLGTEPLQSRELFRQLKQSESS